MPNQDWETIRKLIFLRPATVEEAEKNWDIAKSFISQLLKDAREEQEAKHSLSNEEAWEEYEAMQIEIRQQERERVIKIIDGMMNKLGMDDIQLVTLTELKSNLQKNI